MLISLPKACEILNLNVKEAGPKMSPDVHAALYLAVACMEAIQDYRDDTDTELFAPLPGEEVPLFDSDSPPSPPQTKPQ